MMPVRSLAAAVNSFRGRGLLFRLLDVLDETVPFPGWTKGFR